MSQDGKEERTHETPGGSRNPTHLSPLWAQPKATTKMLPYFCPPGYQTASHGQGYLESPLTEETGAIWESFQEEGEGSWNWEDFSGSNCRGEGVEQVLD